MALLPRQRTWCSFSAAAVLPPHSSVNREWLIIISTWPAVLVALRFTPTLCPLFLRTRQYKGRAADKRKQ